jgi:hypothetical protein
MNRRLLIRVSILLLVVISLPSHRSPVQAQDKPAEPIVVAEGLPLTVVTLEDISSKKVKLGDALVFKVDADVLVSGRVLISRGTLAKGSVINAEGGSRMMGKSGKLGIAVESTKTVDGQDLKLRAAKGVEGNANTGKTVIVGPFFKGSEAKIPAATPITVYVAEQKRFKVVDGNLVADNPPPSTEAASAAASAQPVTVYVYRQHKYAGGALEPSVFCDGTELARMDNGRYFVLRLPPGKHLVHMTKEKKGFAIDMGPGQTFYFRVGIEAGMWKGEGKLTLEDAEKAQPEIKKIKYMGKDKIKDHTMVLDDDPNQAKP